MSDLLVATDMQIHNDNENFQTYFYDRNRRFLVRSGTRCAYVQLKLRDYVDQNMMQASRATAQSQASAIAVRLWEARWHEKLPWSIAEFAIHHTSLQVVCELRVEPT